jgi:beta-phosphoglucomutase-like phosphatase (HAD superfamily)
VIAAFLFDFDGLLHDSEIAEYGLDAGATHQALARRRDYALPAPRAA